MWLRRSPTRAAARNPPPLKFACSSFKDVNNIFSPDAADADTLDSPGIYHRSRTGSVKSLLRTLSQQGCPPSGDITPKARIAEDSVVIYFTSLRVVRRTFEDCKAVRTILRAFRVPIDERDVSMDSSFMDELKKILGPSRRSKLTLPRVFIGGRYIGGVDEVRHLHESGDIKSYVEGLPAAEPGTCEECGGYRFILCQECSGSRKCYSEKSGFRICTLCNENGLIRCSSCSTAPL